MAINFILNDPVNNDQSEDLQFNNSPDDGGTTDTDVLVSTLPEELRDRLFNVGGDGGLGLDQTFPDLVGAATEENSVTVSTDGNSLNGLGFTGLNGEEFAVFDGANFGEGGATGLTTLAGNDILLYRDADDGLGNQMVLGIEDTTGEVIFAIYMEQDFTSPSTAEVDLHLVTFAPVSHPDAGATAADHDDEVDLGEFLTISASQTTFFDFAGVPAGKNLFLMLEEDGLGLVLTPADETISLNTSQGNTSLGLEKTLGFDNNWIQQGQQIFFTFVSDPEPEFTVPDLDQTEADDENNIQYDEIQDISGGSIVVGTIGGGGPASLSLDAFKTNESPEPQGDGYILGTGNDTQIEITFVRVTAFGETEPKAEFTDLGNDDPREGDDGIVVIFNDDGSVTVQNLAEGDFIEYVGAETHQRFSVTGEGGKWRLGGAGSDRTSDDYAAVGHNVVIDDDGPTAAIALTGVHVVHDESDGLQDTGFPLLDGDGNVVEDNDDDDQSGDPPSAITDFEDALNTDADPDNDVVRIGWAQSDGAVVTTAGSGFGTDGAGSSVLSLELSEQGADSGLDVLSGDPIRLFKEGDLVVGRVDDGGGTPEEGDVAIVLWLDQDGVLSTAQYLALFNPDPDDPDDQIQIQNGVLSAKVTVTDGDDDVATAEVDLGDDPTTPIGEDDPKTSENNEAVVRFEDAFPEASGAATETLEEDDLDDPPTLSQGNDEDGSGDHDSRTIDLLAGTDVFADADEPVSFNLKDLSQADLQAALPALLSKGEPLHYELSLNDAIEDPGGDASADVIRAYTAFETDDQRLVFTFIFIDLGDGNGSATLRLNDQLDHEVADPTGDEEAPAAPGENLALQLVGGGTIESIDFTNVLDIKDADGDPVPLPDEFVEFEVMDDVPIFTDDIEGGTVAFQVGAAGDFVTESLNGSVGTDENDGDDEAFDGTKTYTFTGFTILDDSSIDDLKGDIIEDGTRVVFFTDGEGGTLNEFDDGIDTLWFDNVIDQGAFGGAGSYTFTVHQEAPDLFSLFDFDDQPAGNNLFGMVGDSAKAIVVFASDPDLDGDGVMTSQSQTVNTSKGSKFSDSVIGVDNNHFDNVGEDLWLLFVSESNPEFLAGFDDGVITGLDQNEADDANNIDYASIDEVSSAFYQASRVVSKESAQTIYAYDLADNTLKGVDLVDALDTDGGSPPNPTGATQVDIVAVNIYAPIDLRPEGTSLAEDGVIVAQETRGGPDTSALITFNPDGSVTVTGVAEGMVVEWVTDGVADAFNIDYVSGKYDIGFIGSAQGQDTPDALFDFDVKITDFDGDMEESNTFEVLVDGTGAFDDDIYNPDPVV